MADEKEEKQVDVEDLETEGEDVKGGGLKALKNAPARRDGIRKLDTAQKSTSQTVRRPDIDPSRNQ